MRAWLSIALLLGACGRSGDECLELLKTRSYDRALPVCERAFASGGEVEHGLAVARASFYLDRDDDVLRLADRLRDTNRGGDALFLAGYIHTKRHQPDAA